MFSSIRNGRREVLFAHELVPGDIVDLDVGDRVPADLRLFEVLQYTVTIIGCFNSVKQD